ncbi:MAG: ABC transporter ATP-binding protein [Actinobacteria bacterium]|nr:ABC transporter ATP-binding protein [Actinomycetota bacterium]
MTPATLAIDVADVVKHYGDLRALDGLSLAIAPGEVFGLLGPNGAGKTTTVEILEGYRRPDAGAVRVLGLDPARDGARLRPRIGVMLQDGGLYPGLRPLEVLRLFAAYYDEAEDPDALIDIVGLRDATRTMVRRLSGGQRQRLSLACALVGKPEIVFLDEPTAGMDPHARATTWRLVRDLAGRGVTVMLTTHAMDEAEHLCDRVAIVDHGRIVAEGAPADLTRSVARDEVGFVSEPGVDTGALADALGLGADGVQEARPGEYVVTAPGSPGLVADLAVWMRDHGHQIDELHTGRRSLEEVFLRLTSETRDGADPDLEDAR